MKHSDFKIGMRFRSQPGCGAWQVTDIGTRVIVAIYVKGGWMAGPPYASAEMVFDENDFPACEPVGAADGPVR